MSRHPCLAHHKLKWARVRRAMGRGSICAGSTLGERLYAVRGDGRAGGVFLGVRSGMGGWPYGEAEVSAWAVIVLMLRQELLLRLLFV